MVCPKCNSHIDNEEAKFCGNCGAPLVREADSQEPKKSGQGEQRQTGQSQRGKTRKKQSRSSSQTVILLAGGVIAALAAAGIIILIFSFTNKKDSGSDAQGTIEEAGLLEDSGGLGDEIENPQEGENGNVKDGDAQEVLPADTAETEAPVISGWQQDDGKWYYYDEQGTMLVNTWVENYYVGADGVMLTNTLTSDGYWLGEDGLASEEKRIYGDCLFAPDSYTIEGDKIRITGKICDSAYGSQAMMESLQIGDTIIRPSDNFSGRVCEFDTTSAITDIAYYDYPDEDDTVKTTQVKTVYVYTQGSFNESYYTCYAMNAREMYWDCDDSMPQPLYRIIQRDVVLTADLNVSFESAGAEYYPASMMEFLERCCQGQENLYSVLKIGLTGDHIDWIEDIAMNYAG